MRCIFICIDFLYHAPIAMNQQEFYFELKEGKIKAKPGFGFYTKIDLGIALIRAYPHLTSVAGWEYPEGPFRESSHRFRIKLSSRERNPKRRGAGESSNRHF